MWHHLPHLACGITSLIVCSLWVDIHAPCLEHACGITYLTLLVASPDSLCLWHHQPHSLHLWFDLHVDCLETAGGIVVVCGEGITYADGTPVSASETKDKFGNTEFGAMGGTSAAMALHRIISDEFGFRGEFQVTESLPMCAADRAVDVDIDEAYGCGRRAVTIASQGATGVMVAMRRGAGANYKCEYAVAPLSDVAVNAKPLPDEFINPQGNFVTDAFLEYLRPLVGEMPKYAQLSNKKVRLETT